MANQQRVAAYRERQTARYSSRSAIFEKVITGSANFAETLARLEARRRSVSGAAMTESADQPLREPMAAANASLDARRAGG